MDNQLNRELCFQLYVASKEIIRAYQPFLEPYDLTYTGFIALSAIQGGMSVKELGNELFLDSGTLSPLLKKLEKQGLIVRTRSPQDERQLVIQLTNQGERVKKELPCISENVHTSLVKEVGDSDFSQLQQQLVQLNHLFRQKNG